MNFTLRQLQVFLATAHFENISRAADSLAMSQSAASGALKELEQHYDIQLFDRVGKRLQLNEQGRLFRPSAAALLEQAQGLDQALRQHAGIGEIRVGATLTIGNYLAVEIIARFIAQQPQARVSLEVANTRSVVQQVLNFDIDVGLIEGEIQHPDLEIIPWRDDRLVVFSAPDHPLSRKRRVNDADLRAAEWILREPGSGTRQSFERAMKGLLPELRVLLTLQHTEAIKRAVEKNLGISCLSAITLEDAFRRGSLVPLKVAERDFSRQFYFVLHREKYRSAGIAAWLDCCRQ